MKQESFDHEFNKIFKWLGNESAPSLLKYDLDLYKKLWNFFLIGDSYYFIINHHSLTLEFVSKEVEYDVRFRKKNGDYVRIGPQKYRGIGR